MLKYNGGKLRAEVREAPAFLSPIFYQSLDSFYIYFFFLQTKLKSAVQLQDILDATRMLVPRTRQNHELNSLCLCLQKACLIYPFHVLNTGNDNMVFLFLYVDQVVRVIVIQKTLIEHAEKLRQVKAVLEEVLQYFLSLC